MFDEKVNRILLHTAILIQTKFIGTIMRVRKSVLSNLDHLGDVFKL